MCTGGVRLHKNPIGEIAESWRALEMVSAREHCTDVVIRGREIINSQKELIEQECRK